MLCIRWDVFQSVRESGMHIVRDKSLVIGKPYHLSAYINTVVVDNISCINIDLEGLGEERKTRATKGRTCRVLIENVVRERGSKTRQN